MKNNELFSVKMMFLVITLFIMSVGCATAQDKDYKGKLVYSIDSLECNKYIGEDISTSLHDRNDYIIVSADKSKLTIGKRKFIIIDFNWFSSKPDNYSWEALVKSKSDTFEVYASDLMSYSPSVITESFTDGGIIQRVYKVGPHQYPTQTYKHDTGYKPGLEGYSAALVGINEREVDPCKSWLTLTDSTCTLIVNRNNKMLEIGSGKAIRKKSYDSGKGQTVYEYEYYDYNNIHRNITIVMSNSFSKKEVEILFISGYGVTYHLDAAKI